jgi:hypothetical protein
MIAFYGGSIATIAGCVVLVIREGLSLERSLSSSSLRYWLVRSLRLILYGIILTLATRLVLLGFGSSPTSYDSFGELFVPFGIWFLAAAISFGVIFLGWELGDEV